MAQNPRRYFAPRYFAGRYWGGDELPPGSLFAAITGTSTVAADLTSPQKPLVAALMGSASVAALLVAGSSGSISATIAAGASVSASIVGIYTPPAQPEAEAQPAGGSVRARRGRTRSAPDYVSPRIAAPVHVVTPTATVIARGGLEADPTIIRAKVQKPTKAAPVSPPPKKPKPAPAPVVSLEDDDLFVMSFVTSFLSKANGTRTHGIVA